MIIKEGVLLLFGAFILVIAIIAIEARDFLDEWKDKEEDEKRN